MGASSITFTKGSYPERIRVSELDSTRVYFYERTCRDVSGPEFFKCSACGHGIEVEYDDSRLYDGDDMAEDFKYCPYCGAKVVGE